MRVVVTGAAGNIGAPLVRALRERGDTVLGVDTKPGWREDYITADIRNPADMLGILDFYPDVIYHLASMVSRVTCEAAPSMAIDTNLVGTQNVIEIAKRVRARLVYFSTSEVYGNTTQLMRETMPCEPNNRYGLSKLLGERLVEYEAAENGLDAITLRPFMMYDEHEDMGAHRSAMIRFAENLCRRQPIEVHKGTARGWIHVSDAVRAIIAAGDHVGDYTIVNIGHPDIRPMLELANMINRHFTVDPNLIRIVDQPGRMTMVKNPHLARQYDLLGVAPSVTLEDGVERVCAAVRYRVARGVE
jgi:nucleoside-diphosphate-sugar epimerase